MTCIYIRPGIVSHQTFYVGGQSFFLYSLIRVWNSVGVSLAGGVGTIWR